MSGRGRYWPVALGALLVVSAAANVALIVVASGDPSFAVERDYYRKALAWDATMAQERRNAELGWSLGATLEPASSGGARLGVVLHDREARVIAAALVTVEAFHRARAGDVVSVTLVPGAAGRYEATLPVSRSGVWELRFRVEHAAETFTSVLTRELRRSP